MNNLKPPCRMRWLFDGCSRPLLPTMGYRSLSCNPLRLLPISAAAVCTSACARCHDILNCGAPSCRSSRGDAAGPGSVACSRALWARCSRHRQLHILHTRNQQQHSPCSPRGHHRSLEPAADPDYISRARASNLARAPTELKQQLSSTVPELERSSTSAGLMVKREFGCTSMHLQTARLQHAGSTARIQTL